MISEKIYTADGSTSVYQVDWKIPSSNHVNVYLDDVIQEVGAWEIVNNSIKFIETPTSGASILIKVGTSIDELEENPTGTSIIVDDLAGNNFIGICATNIDKIEVVGADLSGSNYTGVVADNIASVTSVGSNIGSITTVNDNIALLETIGTNLPEILLADDNATIATTQAGIATAQAVIATNKASEASGYATSASGSATTATTGATTATTQAGIATTKASEASGYRDEALTFRNEAEAFRDEAETFAGTLTLTLNDSITTTTDVWSSSKIQSELDTKADEANPTFTGLIKEQVSTSTLTLGATSSVQTYTATADFTIVDDLEDGEFVTMILTNGGFTPTYPTITWWGDAEPTLGTTDKLFFEKIGSVLYGSHVGTIA